MYMILLVLDDNVPRPNIGSLGEPGSLRVTIIESSGMHRRRLKRIPMRYLYSGTAMEENGNTTLFVIVKQES
jgi:hypothetical protein